uniref:Uncharacterized protein n=1 Tax=Anopheles atroparvus TaxID=41427 RepID=A0AAG5DG54_ANOAO
MSNEQLNKGNNVATKSRIPIASEPSSPTRYQTISLKITPLLFDTQPSTSRIPSPSQVSPVSSAAVSVNYDVSQPTTPNCLPRSSKIPIFVSRSPVVPISVISSDLPTGSQHAKKRKPSFSTINIQSDGEEI